MSKSSRRERRARRRAEAESQRTTPSPEPLKIVVVTTPTTDDAGISFHSDVRLVKSALLYADKVELVSPAAHMLAAIAVATTQGDEFTVDLLKTLDDDVLRYLGVEDGAEGVQRLLGPLRDASRESRSERRKRLGAEGARRQRELLDVLLKPLSDIASKMADVTEKVWSGAGGDALLAAADRELLTLDAGLVDVNAPTDQQVEQYVATIRRVLADPGLHVIFDDRTATMVRSLAAEGLPIHPVTDRHAKKAIAATGFIDRLPAFPGSSIESIFEARDELADLLHGYRRGVANLAGKLESGLAEASLRAEVNDLWHDEVQPSLTNLRKGLSRTRLAADAALQFLTDPKAVAAAIAGPAVYFGVNAIDELAGLSTSAIAASAPLAVSAAARAAQDGVKKVRDARTHDLYYLLALDRQL